MNFSVNERINVVKWFYMAIEGRSKNNASLIVQDKWRQTYERAPPKRVTILKIMKKFETLGNISNQYKTCGKPKTVVTLEHCAAVHNYLIDEPTTSQRQLA